MADHFSREQLNKDVRDILARGPVRPGSQPFTMTEKIRAAIDANTPRRPV